MTKTQITTGKVRFSYCYLFAPRPDGPDGSAGKYGVTLLIAKSDKATLQKVKSAIAAAKEVYRSNNPNKPLPKDLKTTLYDGDGERPNGGEYGPECKGHWVLSTSSRRQPVIVDADKVPITDSAELYSGCYGRAVLNFYVYDRNGNKGVSAGLNGVMKLYDGDPLAGGVVTDADWDDGWEDEDDDLL